MKLQNADTQPPVGIWPSDIVSLAFASDEFFDVLDMIYLERDGITPAMPRNDRLRGVRGLVGVPGREGCRHENGGK